MNDLSGGQERILRRALAAFLTGVTIVTTIDSEGRPRGFTANSFTSVSLTPPLILICVAKAAASFEEFRKGKFFAINVLEENQKFAAIKFASRDVDKFSSVEWTPGKTRAPIIGHSLAWLDCHTRSVIVAGDHIIVIGEVVDFREQAGRPLGYFRSGFVGFTPGGDQIEHLHLNNGVMGCIAQSENRVLLAKKRTNSFWAIPRGDLIARGGAPADAVKKVFRELGADVEIAFLFSVYNDSRTGGLKVIYRGQLRDIDALHDSEELEFCLFELGDLPWDHLSASDAMMLRRFAQEAAAGRFSVYAQYDDRGRFGSLDL
jgi:flavin reductase (DIM6/NTAB) family NADH-FMN oxidoreductase RutF/ADP-ribose pyrophosphatase YjhB (NUDIX family)